mmetsp:Transcript_13366/g.11866  ORF Transcript_13366/g.11866 Transcript_13366/m.11866 type:complete len:169 (+) Transcript_13366:89-595(+)
MIGLRKKTRQRKFFEKRKWLWSKSLKTKNEFEDILYSIIPEESVDKLQDIICVFLNSQDTTILFKIYMVFNEMILDKNIDSEENIQNLQDFELIEKYFIHSQNSTEEMYEMVMIFLVNFTSLELNDSITEFIIQSGFISALLQTNDEKVLNIIGNLSIHKPLKEEFLK